MDSAISGKVPSSLPGNVDIPDHLQHNSLPELPCHMPGLIWPEHLQPSVFLLHCLRILDNSMRVRQWGVHVNVQSNSGILPIDKVKWRPASRGLSCCPITE